CRQAEQNACKTDLWPANHRHSSSVSRRCTTGMACAVPYFGGTCVTSSTVFVDHVRTVRPEHLIRIPVATRAGLTHVCSQRCATTARSSASDCVLSLAVARETPLQQAGNNRKRITQSEIQ